MEAAVFTGKFKIQFTPEERAVKGDILPQGQRDWDALFPGGQFGQRKADYAGSAGQRKTGPQHQLAQGGSRPVVQLEQKKALLRNENESGGESSDFGFRKKIRFVFRI